MIKNVKLLVTVRIEGKDEKHIKELSKVACEDIYVGHIGCGEKGCYSLESKKAVVMK